MSRRVAYIGNFRPPHSTENHVRDALALLGHDVVPFQEDDIMAWDASGPITDADVILWTHTHGLASGAGTNMLNAARDAGVPTVGFHLDRWWGLDRAEQVNTEPFFRVDLLVTADGSHDAEWMRRDIAHVWMPPAVARAETERVGVFNEQFDYDVVFVGSWQNYHVDAWPYRRLLVENLLARYPGRFRPFCCHWRGQDLADLYTTARVVIGDSCLVDTAHHYWSDRIPETLGRGGFLIHPDVDGLDEWYLPSVDLVTYPLGDWTALYGKIDSWLDDEIGRHRIANNGRRLVRTRDLYEHRLAQVLRLVDATRDLSDWVGPATVTNQGVVGQFNIRRPGDGIVLEETWHANQYGFTRDEIAGRTVVDVGANIGDFTIWCALAGAEKVYAYEPDPANLEALHENLALNGLGPDQRYDGRVVVVAEAVHSKTEDVWLAGQQGSTRTVVEPPATLTGPERLASGRVVDSVLARAGRGLIVKMDCEGCEYGVIGAVAPGHLERVDRLVMEFHSGNGFGGDSDTPGSFGKLVTKLAAQGELWTLGQPSKGGMIRWRRYGS